ARFVGADADELVWTRNATEGINLVAYALANASGARAGSAAGPPHLGPGDELPTTELEHHASLNPCQELKHRTGANLRHLPAHDHRRLVLDDLPTLLGERTRLVAISHVSNVTGAVQPIADIVARAQAVGALTVLDACQSAPHLPLGLHDLGVDFAVFSG